MKKHRIYFGIMLLIAVISMTLVSIATLGEKSIEKGDCYDRRNNKINEVTCDKIVYEKQHLISWAHVCIPFMVLFGAMSVFVVFKED